MKVPAWEYASSDVIAELREALSYDPETGIITRIKKTGPNVTVGAEAGFASHGYRRVRAAGRVWASHHVAWLLHHGFAPDGIIDHINGKPNDNRICNLRVATPSINTQNLKRARCDNALGVLGVRARRDNKFEARIMVDSKAVYLGSFCTAEEASAAYVTAKRQLHAGGTL